MTSVFTAVLYSRHIRVSQLLHTENTDKINKPKPSPFENSPCKTSLFKKWKMALLVVNHKAYFSLFYTTVTKNLLVRKEKKEYQKVLKG